MQSGQRQSERYRLEVPVLFSWRDEHGIRQVGEGLTRDLSVSGAFVFTRTCPPLGAQARIELLLPSLFGPAPSLRIRTKGTVMRVNPELAGQAGGFAVQNRDYVLEETTE